MSSFITPHSIFIPLKLNPFVLKPSLRPFSTTATPYPLQYEMIISRPAHQPLPETRGRKSRRKLNSKPTDLEQPDSELGFDDWVDKKLESTSSSSSSSSLSNDLDMDKAKRKYYNKRSKRMFGSDSEDDGNRANDSDFVELKQEVVELRTLHKKEEELYFHDTFCYPWEKEKHYKMVYQLEKKYFPDQCFDKAFLEPGQSNENAKKTKKKPIKNERVIEKGVDGGDDKSLLFFEDEDKGVTEKGESKDTKIVVTEKKVEEFFKCLKKTPNKNAGVVNVEPFLASRSTGLPPKWDSPGGTVVLVNKPKGDLEIYIALSS